MSEMLIDVRLMVLLPQQGGKEANRNIKFIRCSLLFCYFSLKSAECIQERLFWDSVYQLI